MKWQCVQAQHMLGYCRIETIHYDTEMSTFIICMFTNIRDVGKVCHGFTETQIIVVVVFLNSKSHLFVIYSVQYNIWLYFISYYRKINKSLKASHIHWTSLKKNNEICLFKTMDFEPATSGRIDTRAWSNIIWITKKCEYLIDAFVT